jgi:hypothetical protein
MIVNLDRWVRDGTPPPRSRYPNLADGTLVPFSKYKFPALPGVTVPHDMSEAWHLDFGPDWQAGVLSVQPPILGKPFPALVPQADADGTDLGGIRPPELSAPLATYVGWNLRDPSIGAPDQRIAFEGSYLPFAKTAAERRQTGDPRKSMGERYGSRQDYLTRYQQAVEELIRERYLLDLDRGALIQLGEREWDLATQLQGSVPQTELLKTR